MDNKQLINVFRKMLELAKSDPEALDKADIYNFFNGKKIASLPTDKPSPPTGKLKVVPDQPADTPAGKGDKIKSLIDALANKTKTKKPKTKSTSSATKTTKPIKTHAPIDKPKTTKPVIKSEEATQHEVLEKGIKEKVAAFMMAGALVKNQTQHHLSTFWDEINRNDGAFYHAFSDDPRSAAQDKNTLNQLHLKAQTLGPDAIRMLEGFHAYHQGRVTGKHAAKPDRPGALEMSEKQQNLNKANVQCPHCKNKTVTATLDKFKMCGTCHTKKIKKEIKEKIRDKRANLLKDPKYREYLGDDKVKQSDELGRENPYKPKNLGGPERSRDDEKR